VKRGTTIGKTGLRMAIGAALLVWIFHTIFVLEGRHAWQQLGHSWETLTRFEQWKVAWLHGPQELWETVSLVKPLALVLSLVFMGLTLFLGMMRWRLVLGVQGLHLSFGRTAEISLVAHFFNSFLLGSTGGDLLKAYYAARETQHKKTEAVVTVLIDRLIGLFAMLLFACLLMIPNFDLLASHRRLAALAWVIFLMMVGCGTVVALSFWGGLSRHLPQARLWLKSLPKGELLERALDAARQFGRDRRFLFKAFALSMGINLCCVLQILVLVWGFNLQVPILPFFVIVPAIVCISALPITPNGLGVRENLYVWMLAVPQIGVPAAYGLSLSLLAYAGSLAWSVAGGLVYIMRKDADRLVEVNEVSETTHA
jgi:glycosyltransferase 2 family protein